MILPPHHLLIGFFATISSEINLSVKSNHTFGSETKWRDCEPWLVSSYLKWLCASSEESPINLWRRWSKQDLSLSRALSLKMWTTWRSRWLCWWCWKRRGTLANRLSLSSSIRELPSASQLPSRLAFGFVLLSFSFFLLVLRLGSSAI